MAVRFRYQWHDTAIHRLHAVTKLLLFGTLLNYFEFWFDPIAKLPLIMLLLVLLRIARLPLRAYKPLIWIALVMPLLRLVSWVDVALQADPRLFKVYPQEWVAITFVQITPAGFPILGRTAITLGGLLLIVSGPFRAIPGLLALAGLLHTTSLSEFVTVLRKLRAPFPMVFVTQLALSSAPDVSRRLQMIIKAQRVRGWSMEGRNVLKKVEQIRPLIFPLARQTVRSIEEINIALANRAFGAGPVTPLYEIQLSGRDKAICTLVLVLSGVLLLGSMLRNWGSL